MVRQFLYGNNTQDKTWMVAISKIQDSQWGLFFEFQFFQHIFGCSKAVKTKLWIKVSFTFII